MSQRTIDEQSAYAMHIIKMYPPTNIHTHILDAPGMSGVDNEGIMHTKAISPISEFIHTQ